MNGRRITLGVALIAAVTMLGATALMAQRRGRGAPPSSQLTQARTSPHDVVSQTFDGQRDNRVTLIYGRPFSKNPRGEDIRKIWGALVPWGERWRLGADEATTLIAQKPLMFGQTRVPAGAYTLFMLPVEEGVSKLIINKEIGQWGVDPYHEDQELGRIDLTKAAVETQADQLALAVERNPAGGGVLRIAWENLTFTAAFTIVP